MMVVMSHFPNFNVLVIIAANVLFGSYSKNIRFAYYNITVTSAT